MRIATASNAGHANSSFSQRGWGILALQESSFIEVKTRHDLFGIGPSQVDYLNFNIPWTGHHYVNVRPLITSILSRQDPEPFVDQQTVPEHQPAGQIAAPGDDAADGGHEGEGSNHQSTQEFSSVSAQDGDSSDTDDSSDADDSSDDDDGHVGAPLEDPDVDPEGLNVVHITLFPEPDDGGNESSSVEEDEEPDNEADMGLGNEFDNEDPSEDEFVADDSTAFWEIMQLDSLRISQGGATEESRDYEAIYFPHKGAQKTMSDYGALDVQFLKRLPEFNTISPRDKLCKGNFEHRLHILRTYEKDIEMFGLSESRTQVNGEINTICTDALRFEHFQDEGLRRHFHASSRLNLIAHAPEIGLLVLGSPTGRVLLITLTRMKDKGKYMYSDGEWKHGFRVEAILPAEWVFKKISRPLYGMALGLLQGEAGASFPRTYRLMLHYRSHDILSYEISRDEETGVLGMF